MTPFLFDGHALTLDDGVLSCATHPAGCPLTRTTFTPTQRALINAAADPIAQRRLAYTALVENRVRELAQQRGITLADDFAVKLKIEDPDLN